MDDLPQTYKQLLKDLDNKSMDVSHLMFYPPSELDKMNQVHKVNDFAVGALLIGSDGGGEAIVLDVRENSQTKGGFYFIPFVPMDWKEAKFAGNTLEEIKAKYNELWGKQNKPTSGVKKSQKTV